MDLDAYFDRIHFDGSPRPDEETLFALHEAHLCHLPYENLDIQLGEEKVLDEARFEERLVSERRGGWCFEMNGLFSAALRQIGFRVDRVAGAVVRDLIGEDSVANHMVLLVDLDRRFVADVGLGDGPLHPFPLERRSWSESGFEFALERAEDDWWRFQNHEHGLAPRFDFKENPCTLDAYQDQCRQLQSAEASPFIALAMTFRRDRKRIRALRELTYLEIEGSRKTERKIQDLDEYSRTLGALIDFDLGADLERLWARVSARVAERASQAAETEASARAAESGESVKGA
ncbi:MAG: arylamine N-acetyltransferase [bacterium]|nr:hypothetical protein [Deltaproteobacteria bacterium]MCP4906296.1 arylamine N-acetyltransferase [bacterium]